MAALRSVLAMLGRCGCVSPRPSAAAFIAGRQPEIHPAAVRNLEGWRYFSTGGIEPAAKARSGPRMWWQWARDRMENGPIEERNRLMFVYTVFVLGTPAVVVFKTLSEIIRMR